MKIGLNKLKRYNIALSYISIMLNRLGDHECDRRTGRQTEPPLAVARSNINAR